MAQLYDIATGTSANSKRWKNERLTWKSLVKRLQKVVITPETYAQFIASPKEEQSSLKDVGGFVGGYLRGGRRKPANVTHRQLLTLDLDYATLHFWDIFELMLGCAAVCHGTHKHSDETPRYRLVIPLDREVAADEYEAIARKLAGSLNIELFDRTTFQVSRLMFWPSISSDSEYYFREQKGEPLCADDILAEYVDWTDAYSWPTSAKEFKELKGLVKKQEDPTTKRGLVGAFCRTYNIHEVIEAYIPDLYTQCDDPNRYTYALGTTSAGAIVYDDNFLYSHHGTDPTSGQLCNAFDLVRLHKFGHMDDDQYKKGASSPSFREMDKLMRADNNVVRRIGEDRISEARYEFAEDEEAEEETPAPKKKNGNTRNVEEAKIEFKSKLDKDWLEKLQIDARGVMLSSSHNLNLILRNDAKINKLFAYNSFDGNRYLANSAPWRVIKQPEVMTDVDYSGLRNYLDSFYGVSNSGKVEDALALVFSQNTFHPIRQFLLGLEWDGVPRVDTLLIDYLGAVDNAYTREAMRKTLVAAVARIFHPGTKFDMALILAGKQGKGKSTFVRKLGMSKWASDSFSTVQGKESFEQLQGSWIVEMAELSAMKKTEVEQTKLYISKQFDRYRPAYGHTVQDFKRQCVFIGSSNRDDFLRDPTGNRRFNPVETRDECATKDVRFSTEMEDNMRQVWAEALDLYCSGEDLWLSPEAEAIATQEQKNFSEVDARAGVIDNYLNTLLPDNWKSLDVYSRRMYLELPAKEQKGDNLRTKVCAAEIWVECLGMDRQGLNSRNTREVNDILRTLDGWRQAKNVRGFAIYGSQRYYEREEG